MYELKIYSSSGTVCVESSEFAYVKDVQEALVSIEMKHEAQTREKLNGILNKVFDAEVKKQPAKKRGRPVGSTNKARKAK